MLSSSPRDAHGCFGWLLRWDRERLYHAQRFAVPRGPRGPLRMTRGRCSSLRLHRDGLAPSTFRRSPDAPVHSIKTGHWLAYSITSSARASSDGGTVIARALAVITL